MSKAITLHKRCKEQRLPFLAPHFHSVLENTTLDHFGVFRVSAEQPCGGVLILLYHHLQPVIKCFLSVVVHACNLST